MKQVGIGTRVLNFLIDTTVIFAISYFAHQYWLWYVFYYHAVFISFGWFFFTTLFLYYFILESIFARTLGKWLSFSKVVDATGKKPGVGLILIRSLARLIIIDPFFIPFLDKTLHDYLSKTNVCEV